MDDRLKTTISDWASARSLQRQWWMRIVAVVALCNLLMGLFNLSYVAMRDVYLRFVPWVVTIYDPVKGIEPHPQTQRYLQVVNQLQEQRSPGLAIDLSAPEVQNLLADLRQKSDALVEEKPFAVAEKIPTFAKLERRIQERVNTQSTKVALRTFWSTDYLGDRGFRTEMDFFDRKIRPLLNSNYFRQVDDYGQFVDLYWRIDAWFVAFFAVEYLFRTFVISRGKPAGISWGDTMLRYWYDALLLIPAWRWLRVIPVTVKLHRSGLVNLERPLAQITYEPAAYLSDRVSEFVTVRAIDQAQLSIRQGDAARALFGTSEYVRINEVEEVEAIAERLIQLTVYRVLPQIQPELQSVLRHNLDSAFKQSAFYEALQQLPGFANLPEGAIDRLANYLAQSTCDVLVASYTDERGKEQFERLTEAFRQALSQELQEGGMLEELQALLVDWLEELKINYVQRSGTYDPEETISQLEQLQQ